VGPLTPTVLGECSAWSVTKGYSQGSAAGIVNLLERLSLWMQDVGAGVDDIDEDLLAEFVAAERSRDRPCSSVKRWTGDAPVLGVRWLSGCVHDKTGPTSRRSRRRSRSGVRGCTASAV
jgi:hypothetical protein